jgi:hypothetical protein
LKNSLLAGRFDIGRPNLTDGIDELVLESQFPPKMSTYFSQLPIEILS